MSKPIAFSGIQPSGNLHIGNYLGAIKQWVNLQNAGEHELIFCIVDEHAITTPQDPKALHKNTLDVAMLYIAAGIDPSNATIFIQSHVSAHAELGWILNTITPMGELQRMTQFKDKISRRNVQVLAGLLNYPTLMAADILLYNTDVVPVGEDQTQHVEITREIARKFNAQFGETFKVPKLMLTEAGARVMRLTDPTRKMAKSATDPNSRIEILDSPDTIAKKIKSATTDSGSDIRYDEDEKPGISNLLNIASGFSGKAVSELEKEFSGKTYEDFKGAVADIVIGHLTPLQTKYNELASNEDELKKILREGSEQAKKTADATMGNVREKIGFVSA